MLCPTRIFDITTDMMGVFGYSQKLHPAVICCSFSGIFKSVGILDFARGPRINYLTPRSPRCFTHSNVIRIVANKPLSFAKTLHETIEGLRENMDSSCNSYLPTSVLLVFLVLLQAEEPAIVVAKILPFMQHDLKAHVFMCAGIHSATVQVINQLF